MRELEFSQQKMIAKRGDLQSLSPTSPDTSPQSIQHLLNIYAQSCHQAFEHTTSSHCCLKNSFSSFKMYLLKDWVTPGEVSLWLPIPTPQNKQPFLIRRYHIPSEPLISECAGVRGIFIIKPMKFKLPTSLIQAPSKALEESLTSYSHIHTFS